MYFISTTPKNRSPKRPARLAEYPLLGPVLTDQLCHLEILLLNYVYRFLNGLSRRISILLCQMWILLDNYLNIIAIFSSQTGFFGRRIGG
jgi:hypothetical protein